MRHLTRRSGAWMAMAALAVFGGCSNNDNGTSGYGDNGSRGGMRESTTVELTSTHTFHPREVTIRSGEAVTWKNISKDVHTVTADPARASKKENVSLPPGARPFHSGEIEPGKSWKMTFSTPGTYKYLCTFHEDHGMLGTIIVKPAATEPSPY
jgi:plastocyanin